MSETLQTAACCTIRNAATQPETLVVDVRTPAEYQEVHIPGSLNVPLPDVEKSLREILAQAGDREVLLVCRTGSRAKVAQEKLNGAGWNRTRVLEGGVMAWQEAGKEVHRGRKAISLERQVRIAAGSLVALGTALGAFVTPWFLVVPAFVGAGLVFAGVTDTCGMAMLLARLPFNRAPKQTACKI